MLVASTVGILVAPIKLSDTWEKRLNSVAATVWVLTSFAILALAVLLAALQFIYPPERL
jgi:hypothetical protein